MTDRTFVGPPRRVEWHDALDAREREALRSIVDGDEFDVEDTAPNVLFQFAQEFPRDFLGVISTESVYERAIELLLGRDDRYFAWELLRAPHEWKDKDEWKRLIIDLARFVMSEDGNEGMRWLFVDSLVDEVMYYDQDLAHWWHEVCDVDGLMDQLSRTERY